MKGFLEMFTVAEKMLFCNFGSRNRMDTTFLFLVLLLINVVVAEKAPSLTVPLNAGKTALPTSSEPWLTLNGDPPLVVARGGLSGIFPDSSFFGYELAMTTSLPDLVLYCDLQLTKDGQGICQSDIRLDNGTDIANVFPKGVRTYKVNGEDVEGWFAIDFTFKEIYRNVSVYQNVLSRPMIFDGYLPMCSVDNVAGFQAKHIWLNVQYDMFYTEHKLSVVSYIQTASRKTHFSYISSPEIGFLKSLRGKVDKLKTKLMFRFLDKDEVEPTTKKDYGSILEDLASIKTFASGILVPKNYIWPVNANHYLESPTTLITDAHKEGLEVYASDFSNDMPISFNYSGDPSAEYLQYIDNTAKFSVDGFLTDFPPTASEAVGCLAHTKNNNKTNRGLIISHDGASGIFPACTDMAYQRAIDDGVDIIDCSVQMSKDGVAFCFDSPDLTRDSNAMSTFLPRASVVSEIQSQKGIFSFDLTWREIQTLKPQLISATANYGMVRHPENNGKGKFLTLNEFLELAKAKAVSGFLINIENAAYLASKKGFEVTDVVAKALKKETFDKQVTQQVMIQSDDTSVLSEFKKVPSYKRVLSIRELIGSAPKPVAEKIKQYADAVNLGRSSIIRTADFFSTEYTKIVKEMHAANLSVYVSTLRNEYTVIAIDFYSDPITEIATFLSDKIGVDGVVTEYPGTAAAYLRSPCSNPDAVLAFTTQPVEAGFLLQLVAESSMPPAQAPAPPLDANFVIDPPLPPVSVATSKDAPASGPAGAKNSSNQPTNTVNIRLGLAVAITLVSILSLGY